MNALFYSEKYMKGELLFQSSLRPAAKNVYVTNSLIKIKKIEKRTNYDFAFGYKRQTFIFNGINFTVHLLLFGYGHTLHNVTSGLVII